MRRGKSNPWSNRGSLVDRSIDFVEGSFGLIRDGYYEYENDSRYQRKYKRPSNTLDQACTPSRGKPYCSGSPLSSTSSTIGRPAYFFATMTTLFPRLESFGRAEITISNQLVGSGPHCVLVFQVQFLATKMFHFRVQQFSCKL